MNIMTRHVHEDWTLEKLGQLFEERKEKVSDKDFVPLSVTKRGIVPQMEHVAKSDDSDNRKRVVAGDFVINSRSDRRGSSGLSELDGSVSLINMVLKPRHGHPRFIHHLMRSYAFQEEFYRFGHGIVADLWTTRYSELKGITVALPDENTQEEIADFLDRETARIDQLIDRKRRLTSVLEEKYSNIINKTVRQGISHQISTKSVELEGIAEIPEHWKIKKLRHLGSLQNGISEGADYFGEGYPFVGYGDIYNHFSLPANVSGLAKSTELDRKRYSVIRGDVFFTRTSEVAEEIGISSVCLETIDDATFSGFVIRFRPNTKDLLPEFSKYYFRSDIPRIHFIKEMNLVTRVSLSQNLLKSLPVIVPPIDEQEKIAEYLDKKTDKINKLISDVESSIKSLSEFRTSLITEAVTGQLDIKTWKKKGGTDKRLDNIAEAMAS
jgi:type I restriction enzyme S subunit